MMILYFLITTSYTSLQNLNNRVKTYASNFFYFVHISLNNNYMSLIISTFKLLWLIELGNVCFLSF